MAVTLAQAATLSRTELQAGVVETFILTSPVLERAQLLPIEGNAYAYNEESALPAMEFRAVNAAYAESTGAVVQKSESLVILGGDADVDRYIIQTRGNVNDQKAIQTELKVKAAGLKFQDAFFNGDVSVDANSFDGLKKRITGAQILTGPSANGDNIVGTTSAERQLWFDFLDSIIGKVPGATPENSAFFANDLVLAKHSSAARRETITADGADALGRAITTYRGFPMLDAGTRGDGTRILPQTETKGASSVTSSIYLVKFGRNEAERAVTVLYNGPESVFDVRDLGEQDAKPVERVRIEGFLGVAMFGGQAAARGSGILAA
jgi:Major capsid protein GP7